MKHIKDSWIRNSIHALAINIIGPKGCKKSTAKSALIP